MKKWFDGYGLMVSVDDLTEEMAKYRRLMDTCDKLNEINMTQEQKWLAYITDIRLKHDEAIVHFKAYIMNELKVKLSEAKKSGCASDFIEGYEIAIQDLGWFMEEYPIHSEDRL